MVIKVLYDLGHFGWSYFLSKIQARFWILRGQSSVRSCIKNCLFFCQIRNAKSSSQLMAALPTERLKSREQAFYVTGCDLFGPIFVTELRKKL